MLQPMLVRIALIPHLIHDTDRLVRAGIDRIIEGDRIRNGIHCKHHIFPFQFQLPGDLLHCGFAHLRAHELLPHLKHPVGRVAHGAAHPHSGGIPQKAAHLSGDHRNAIGGKAHIVQIHIKIVDGLHKSDAADLKQIVHILASPREALDHGQHQAQISLNHLLPRLLIPPLDLAQQLRHLRIFQHLEG